MFTFKTGKREGDDGDNSHNHDDYKDGKDGKEDVNMIFMTDWMSMPITLRKVIAISMATDDHNREALDDNDIAKHGCCTGLRGDSSIHTSVVEPCCVQV